MKKKLLFVFFILNLLSFSASAQVGFTCANAIPITSLPYQTIDNTANYGDSIDMYQGISCGDWPSGTNYLAGNEVFYNYVADFTGNLTISMQPSGSESANSSLFVYESCTNVGLVCLAGLANANSEARELNVLVFEGQTYKILISSSAVTQTIAYKLTIERNQCSPKPDNLGATNINTTGAKLTWANTGNYSSWQVAIQSEGGIIPTGDGETTTTPFFVKTGLAADTSYQYWVRAECFPGSDTFSQWAGPYVFHTTLCENANKCTYTFILSDAGNDGWNGATMEVRQNGNLMNTVGAYYTSNFSGNVISVQLCKNVPFEIIWDVPGTAPEECGLTVKNSFGQTLYIKQPDDLPGGTIFTGTAVNCVTPICQVVPSNVVVTQLTSNSAVADWTSDTAESWDVYLVPAGSPAPNAQTVPTFANVQKPYTFQDLTENTNYKVYVRSNCNEYTKSPWSLGANFSVIITCYQPTNLHLIDFTTTSAHLAWGKGMPTDNSWEILLIPSLTQTLPTTIPSENPVLENGAVLIPFTGNDTFKNLINLSQGVIYVCYMRTVCSSTDKSYWTPPFMFNTSVCNEADKCQYKILLTDTGGNGWNGAKMQVRQNGIAVISNIGANFNAGFGTVTVNFNICNDTPFDIFWSAAGTAPNEVGFSIQNPFSDIIYTYVPGTGMPLTKLYEDNIPGNCTPPTCPKPTNLQVVSTTQTSAFLSWTPGSNETSWEVYVTPITSPIVVPINGSPISETVPFYITSSNISFEVTNLLPGTSYAYYVRAICSTSDVSTWTILNPKIFATKPINDESINSTLVSVNPDSQSNSFVTGTTIGATASVQLSTCPGNEDDDVWFKFVATSSLHIIKIKNVIGSTINTDVNHALFLGEGEAITQLYCSNPNFSFASNLIIGNTYTIRVYTNGLSPSNGNNPIYVTFDLSITTPPPILNDECSTAISIPISDTLSNYNLVSGTVTGATASAQVSTCAGTEDDDVWYQFVASSTSCLIKVESLENEMSIVNDLRFSIFNGSDCENLTQLYCVDNELVASNLVIGQNYKIRVWSAVNTPVESNFNISVLKVHPPLVANTTQFTNEQLVTNILVNNPCVDISNITSSTGTNFGSLNGIGYFTNTNPYFPLNSGLVLSTGNATSVSGPNLAILGDGNDSNGLWYNAGDTDLEALISASNGQAMISRNATKLEFDFTSQNEFMSFNFLFASEEYGAFQCAYADAFAFLLTDLVTGVTKNLAVVPGTDIPVSVVTIRDEENNPACISQNPSFFDTFFDEFLSQTAATNFNGQTTLMSASSEIIANRAYHIKLVIADRQDGSYDSAVFIQAGSFSSGPPQCTDKVQLVAFIDENNNGTKEDTESSFTYGSFVYQINNTGDDTNISSPIGNYTIYDDTPSNSYDFNYAVHPEYATYFSSGSISHNDISIAVGSGTQTLYFPITQIQGYNDVTVSIVPVGQPTAGFSYTNKVVYTNLGTVATGGTITYAKDPQVTISSTESGVVNTATGFTFDFSNLAPFETKSFNFTVNVPSIPIVNIDDVLESSVAISAPENDINLNNNSFVNSQIVVASYDPNDKMEAHGEKLDFNNFSQNDYLFYTIRFQNTGTANAINIRIEDLLDAQLDEESIRMVSASHNYVMERIGNKVIWKFDYIYLPSHLANEELSNGYLTFRVKVKPGFQVGDIIPNFAEIYFDTNPAIITNTFTSTFEEQLATPEFSSTSLLIYPNPSKGLVYINVQNSNETLSAINLYDILGKIILSSKNLTSRQSILDVSSLAKGVYMIEITTENNFKQTKKLVVN